MKMKILAFAVASMTIATSASAVTQQFDFVEMADEFWNSSGPLGIQYEATWDQGVSFHETGSIVATNGFWDGSILTLGGSGGLLEVKASSAGGTNVAPDPANSDHAFLDYAGQQGPAGLGVCSTGIDTTVSAISRCSTNFIGAGGFGPSNPGDDTVSGLEILELLFSSTVELNSIAAAGLSHVDLEGFVDISVDDGANWTPVLFSGGFGNFATSSNVFWFRPYDPGQDIYIRSVTATDVSSPAPIPLPATGFMLLAGLGGLGLMARRKRKAA